MESKKRNVSFRSPEKATELIPHQVKSKAPNCATEFRDYPTSSLVTISPPTLRFPHNDPEHHSQRLAIWNRTSSPIKVELKSPDPDIFQLHLLGKGFGPVRQFMLYGQSTGTVLIHCRPGQSRIERAYLELYLHTRDDEHEFLLIPLQIFPSTAWFHLPKVIMIPDVVLGRKAHAIIALPQPTSSETFFVAFHPAYTHESVTVTPMNGVIGGEGGLTELKVTYFPKSFTTICLPILIHFPGHSHHGSSSYEMKIVGRCRPGNEADSIRNEILDIEGFRPKPFKPKWKLRRMVLKPVITSLETMGISTEKEQDVFTTGGVMRFLLSKNDDYFTQQAKRITAIEMFSSKVDLSLERKVKMYSNLQKRLGLDPPGDSTGDSSQPTPGNFRLRYRRVWGEFQKIVGFAFQRPKVEELEYPQDDAEGGARGQKHSIIQSHKSSRRSGSQSVGGGEDEIVDHKTQLQKRISEDEKKIFRNLMHDVQLDFTPKQKFIQMGRIVITRIRADLRIAKLRVLINRRKNSARSSALSRASVMSAGTAGRDRHLGSNPRTTSKKSELRGSTANRPETRGSTGSGAPVTRGSIGSGGSNGPKSAEGTRGSFGTKVPESRRTTPETTLGTKTPESRGSTATKLLDSRGSVGSKLSNKSESKNTPASLTQSAKKEQGGNPDTNAEKHGQNQASRKSRQSTHKPPPIAIEGDRRSGSIKSGKSTN